MQAIKNLLNLFLPLIGVAVVVDGMILGIGFLVYALTESESAGVLCVIFILFVFAVLLGLDAAKRTS